MPILHAWFALNSRCRTDYHQIPGPVLPQGFKAFPLGNLSLSLEHPCWDFRSSILRDFARGLRPWDDALRKILHCPNATQSVERFPDASRAASVWLSPFLYQTQCTVNLKRVKVTPAVYQHLIEFLHFDIQSTGRKSLCVNTS